MLLRTEALPDTSRVALSVSSVISAFNPFASDEKPIELVFISMFFLITCSSVILIDTFSKPDTGVIPSGR